MKWFDVTNSTIQCVTKKCQLHTSFLSHFSFTCDAVENNNWAAVDTVHNDNHQWVADKFSKI